MEQHGYDKHMSLTHKARCFYYCELNLCPNVLSLV